MSWQRPKSIAQVAEWTNTWEEAGPHLTDFLHEFSARGSIEMLLEKPRLLAPLFPEGAVCDAYYAATAATLAGRIGERHPAWTRDPERYLTNPWFASPGPSMRACLLLESPARFRERNLFVTANALSVA